MKAFFNVFGAILLTVVMIYTSAHKSWIRLSYEINKLEIIEKFCINKEETSFQCDGKCHLKTQLEEADSSNPKKNQLTEESRITLFNCVFTLLKAPQSLSEQKHRAVYNDLYLFLTEHTIFHPPRA